MTILDQLIKARELYNNGEESPLTDAEYDLLEEQLKQTDPANVFFTGVGASVRGDKIKLPYPMGSLNQIYDGDFRKWINDISPLPLDIVISSKMDGISALLIYDTNGDFQISYSRGDGLEGQDISRHIQKIGNVPLKIQSSSTVALRAECIMSKSNFSKFTIECQSRKYKTYKNARNAVAGLMNSKTIPDWIYQYIDIVVFELISSDSKIDQFQKLKQYGFDVVWYTSTKSNTLTDSKLEQLVKYTKEYSSMSDYEQDGIVLDIDDQSYRTKLSPNSNTLNPEYSRKFKVRDATNIVEVIVVKVHWDPSKNSLIKPKIEIIPVDLNGVTIRFTAGFNAKYIVDNNIGPGARLMLTRSGDVIPYIISVIEESDAPDVPSFDEFGQYIWNKTKVDYILTESNDIVDMKSILSFFVSLDIPALREGSVKKLIEAGYDSIPSILNMTQDQFIEVVGKNGIKMFDGINNRFDNLTQYDFMGSLPFFPGIGKRKFEKIYDIIGQFDQLSLNQIINCEGFDDTTANIIMDNIEQYYEILIQIDRDISFKDKVTRTGKFDNQIFVFTGYRDKSANSIIEEQGGEISNSINIKTTYLVTKDPSKQSSKTVKVQKLNNTKGTNIQVIGPESLWKILNAI